MRDLIALDLSRLGTRMIAPALACSLALAIGGCVATLPPPGTTSPNSNAVAVNGNRNTANSNTNTNAQNQNGSGSGAGQRVDLAIIDFAFEPMTQTIQVGDSVRWRNNGQEDHTVTSGNPGDLDAGQEFASGPLNQGETFEHTFSEAGTFVYFCTIHPDLMRAALIIVEAR